MKSKGWFQLGKFGKIIKEPMVAKWWLNGG